MYLIIILKKLSYLLYILNCSLSREWGLVHLPDLSSHNMGLHSYPAMPLPLVVGPQGEKGPQGGGSPRGKGVRRGVSPKLGGPLGVGGPQEGWGPIGWGVPPPPLLSRKHIQPSLYHSHLSQAYPCFCNSISVSLFVSIKIIFLVSTS